MIQRCIREYGHKTNKINKVKGYMKEGKEDMKSKLEN